MKKQFYKLSLITLLGVSAIAFAQEGVVGINTENPTATLDVKTESGTTKSLRVENTSGKETVTVLENGNVGIGTANPISKLTIGAIGDGKELLRFQTDRPWVFKQEGSEGVSGITLKAEVANKYFKVSNLNNEVIASFRAGEDFEGNKVGIGVDLPTERLDVNGKVKISSLVGTGDRPIVADENGVLKVGQATSTGSTTNLYGADGTLSEARTVNQNGHDLTFTTGANAATIIDGNSKLMGSVYGKVTIIDANTPDMNGARYTVKPDDFHIAVHKIDGESQIFIHIPRPEDAVGRMFIITNEGTNSVAIRLPDGTQALTTTQLGTSGKGRGQWIVSTGTKWFNLINY